MPDLWRDPLLWLSLLLAIFAVAPFLQPGYFWGANDARHHVYFLFEYDRLVQDGIWWPRWSPDFAFGYGYPFFNIYGPLSHFLGELLHRFGGLDLVTSVETIFCLGILASAAAMYGYVRSVAGRGAALLASVAYTYVPYHLLVLYVRGNLAESTAFVWMPLCLWTFRNTVVRPSVRNVVASAACYAGLMLTSNLVFVLFSPLLILYILALIIGQVAMVRDWMGSPGVRFRNVVRASLPPAAGGIGGLGLSAVFWIPMLLERQYVRVDQWFAGDYDFRDDFVYFYQFFSPHWGFGVSGPGPADSIGFQIGAIVLLFAVLGTLIAWRWRLLRPELIVLAVAGAGAAALGWQPLAFLWELPFVGAILQSAQFPWRWLPITALCLSILAGFLLVDDRPPTSSDGPFSLTLFIPIIVLMLGSYPLLQMEIVEPVEGDVGLAALMRFQRDADEMTGSTVWVREIPNWSPVAEEYIIQDRTDQEVTAVTSKVDYASVDYERLAVGSVSHNTVMEEVYFCTDPGDRPGECEARGDQAIVFNHFYYPGWRAYLLDGEPAGRGGEPLEQLPIVPEGCLPPGQEDETRVPCPVFPTYQERATAIANRTTGSTLGRMVVPVPPVGEGHILLRYEDTAPRVAGQWISVVTVLLVVLALVSRLFGNVYRVRHRNNNAS